MRVASFSTVNFSRLLSTYAVVIFVMLWVGFALALLLNREWLEMLWTWVRDLPLVAEIIIWLLFLPIMVGLWIWESSWPAFVRLLAYAGIVLWTVAAGSSFFRVLR